MRFGKISVTVGTNVDYAAKHQMGTSSRFTFGTQQQRTLEKNVAKVLPGAKPRGSRARKHWNPFYFQMLGFFRSKNGSSFRVRQRKIILEQLNTRETRIIQADVTRMVNEQLARRNPPA
jgi:hypothetical protein